MIVSEHHLPFLDLPDLFLLQESINLSHHHLDACTRTRVNGVHHLLWKLLQDAVWEEIMVRQAPLYRHSL